MFTPGHSFGTGPRTGIVFYGSNETIAGLLALSMIVLVLCSLRAFATPFPINLIAILISAPVAYYLTTINSATYAAGPIISLLGGIVGLIQTKRL
ncbi:MAG: hypothetical protein KGH59_01885 [Candidatus Micrarchaeota archaeon]|nr:hypothetical protein [Candidatus Micrarchaeota archaeon]